MATKKDAKEWAREHVKGLWGLHWTPFAEDDSIDEAALREHVRLIADQEPDGISVAGLLAEKWYMTFEERVRIAEIVKEEIGGRIPLMFLVTDHSSANTLRLVEKAQELEFEMVMLQVPYEHAKSDAEMYRFVEFVNDRSDIAMGIYDSPHSGRVMGPELLQAVGRIESVCAVKHGPDFNEFVRTNQLIGDRVVVSYPFESHWLTQMQLCGTRALFSSTTPHLFQSSTWRPIRDYTDLALNGDWKEAYDIFYSLQPLRDLWNELYQVYHLDNRHPIAETKYWLHAQGMISDPRVRRPNRQISAEMAEKIDRVVGSFPQIHAPAPADAVAESSVA